MSHITGLEERYEVIEGRTLQDFLAQCE